MRDLWEEWHEKDGICDSLETADITATITKAIELSKRFKKSITFVFSEVKVTVYPDSDQELIYRDWWRARKGCIDKNVGPYPNPILTEEEKASDARIEAKARAKRKAVKARLANAPEMELADEKAWQKFKDRRQNPFGTSVVAYAERWARLMQLEMAGGKSLEEVAETTSCEANIDGITKFMCSCAVSALIHCWKYGEQLSALSQFQS
jgi:hypothetical protein